METQAMAHRRILAWNGFKSPVQTGHDWNRDSELFIVTFDAIKNGQQVTIELQEDIDGGVEVWYKGRWEDDTAYKSC